jgi:hypothetical protein
MHTAYRRNPGVEATSMKAESLLFDPTTSKFCLLNETAAVVWQRLETPATLEHLVAVVCERFEGVDRSKVEQDVVTLLRRLDELALVAADAPVASAVTQ